MKIYWLLGVILIAGCAQTMPVENTPTITTTPNQTVVDERSFEDLLQNTHLTPNQTQYIVESVENTSTLGTTNKSEDEWREELTRGEYRVIWGQGTEIPYTGELLKENRSGVYITKGCGLPVFESKTKYDSKTGWPSFYDVIEENVIYKEDYLLGYKRIEVLSTCGEHLGHVFDDGPQPTGLRYCMNSAALEFIPDGNTTEPYRA